MVAQELGEKLEKLCSKEMGRASNAAQPKAQCTSIMSYQRDSVEMMKCGI
jgi:hypothetical protein